MAKTKILDYPNCFYCDGDAVRYREVCERQNGDVVWLKAKVCEKHIAEMDRDMAETRKWLKEMDQEQRVARSTRVAKLKNTHEWGVVAQEKTSPYREWAYCEKCRKYKEGGVYVKKSQIPEDAWL